MIQSRILVTKWIKNKINIVSSLTTGCQSIDISAQWKSQQVSGWLELKRAATLAGGDGRAFRLHKMWASATDVKAL